MSHFYKPQTVINGNLGHIGFGIVKLSKKFSISMGESTRIAYYCPRCLTAMTTPVLSHLRWGGQGARSGGRGGGKWGERGGCRGDGRRGDMGREVCNDMCKKLLLFDRKLIENCPKRYH